MVQPKKIAWMARKTHRKTLFLLLIGDRCPRPRTMFMYEPGPYGSGSGSGGDVSVLMSAPPWYLQSGTSRFRRASADLAGGRMNNPASLTAEPINRSAE
jgi:hypothetical protein